MCTSPTPASASIDAYPADGYVFGPTTVKAITPRPPAVMPTVGYVMLASSGPSVTPLNASFEVRPDVADGLRMYQAAPDLSGSSVAVLSAPHSLPLAYMTPVKRLSFAFIGPNWVEPAGGATV